MPRMTWGTYGINGDEPLVIKPIEDLTTTHIINIIKNGKHPSIRL